MKNNISPFHNEPLYISLSYTHFTKVFERMLKDEQIEVAYKTKHTPTNLLQKSES